LGDLGLNKQKPAGNWAGGQDTNETKWNETMNVSGYEKGTKLFSNQYGFVTAQLFHRIDKDGNFWMREYKWSNPKKFSASEVFETAEEAFDALIASAYLRLQGLQEEKQRFLKEQVTAAKT